MKDKKVNPKSHQLKHVVKCETFEQLVQVDEDIYDLVNEKYRIEKEFEEKIKAAKTRRDNIILRGLPQPDWGWDIKVTIQEEQKGSWRIDAPPGTELVSVHKVIKNYDEIKELYELAGVEIPKRDQHNKGMKYYRKNKVLLHCGGGTLWLGNFYDFPIVEDDEWEQIKQGNIPERFLK